VGGNLKQVTLPDASEISYLYDANSNRIQKTNATEIIEYHYAGSERKSEVHKNKQNNTVLYTLTYYPYGFSKTVGQTTTSYYYIVDNRGFVWALTDSVGAIVETYDYSPYGELLSTPSITNHLFLSGADQCIYDEETSMVHLNNRYYIPKIGRFLQRDSVEGTPDSTISQNLYTYCQNSPITLTDPSGNSPQNTGTPARTEFVNPSAYAGGLNCQMPDMNEAIELTLCDSDPIAIDFDAMTAKPQDSPSGEYSACSGDTKTTCVNEETGLPSWEIKNSKGQVIAEDKGDGTGPHYYLTDEDGNLLDAFCEEIDCNDYESVRVEVINYSEIVNQIHTIGKLTLQGKVTGSATFNGETTNVLVGYKMRGDTWIGFSIDSEGNVTGFLNDDFNKIFSVHPEYFKNIKLGSSIVMELRDFDFENRVQTWDVYQYNERDKNGIYILDYPLLYGFRTHIKWPIFFRGGNKGRIRRKKNNE
jgi:RHS repeat-associated protein